MDILKDTNLLGSKLEDTLMEPNVKLCVDQAELLSSLDQYHSTWWIELI